MILGLFRIDLGKAMLPDQGGPVGFEVRARGFQLQQNCKIAAIQGLRAGAAVSVALLHAIGQAANFAAVGDPWRGVGLSRFAVLGAGADLFFVISGIVMVHGDGTCRA